MSDEDLAALDKLMSVTQDDILKKTAKAEQNNARTVINEQEKSKSDLLLQAEQRYSQADMVTLPDFVKATNSNGSAFYVSTAVCSRIDYVDFATKFTEFLKDPMGYEETFDQVFQKQF